MKVLRLRLGKKFNPNESRDDKGRWVHGAGGFTPVPLSHEPDEAWKQEFRDYNAKIVKKHGEVWRAPEINVAFSSEYRNAYDDTSLGLAYRMEKAAGSREAALRVLGDVLSWYNNPRAAFTLWDAAGKMVPVGRLPEGVKLDIAAVNTGGKPEGSYLSREADPITEAHTLAARQFRHEQVEAARAQFGDTVTVYRGVSGAYAGKLDKQIEKWLHGTDEGTAWLKERGKLREAYDKAQEKEYARMRKDNDYSMNYDNLPPKPPLYKGISVPMFSMSSTSTNEDDTYHFAQGKNGMVMRAEVPVEEVFFSTTGPTMRGPIKFSDDNAEIVLVNSGPTRKWDVLKTGGAPKPRRQMGFRSVTFDLGDEYSEDSADQDWTWWLHDVIRGASAALVGYAESEPACGSEPEWKSKRDVSGEARDSHGRWTKDDGTGLVRSHQGPNYRRAKVGFASHTEILSRIKKVAESLTKFSGMHERVGYSDGWLLTSSQVLPVTGRRHDETARKILSDKPNRFDSSKDDQYMVAAYEAGWVRLISTKDGLYATTISGQITSRQEKDLKDLAVMLESPELYHEYKLPNGRYVSRRIKSNVVTKKYDPNQRRDRTGRWTKVSGRYPMDHLNPPPPERVLLAPQSHNSIDPHTAERIKDLTNLNVDDVHRMIENAFGPFAAFNHETCRLSASIWATRDQDTKRPLTCVEFCYDEGPSLRRDKTRLFLDIEYEPGSTKAKSVHISLLTVPKDAQGQTGAGRRVLETVLAIADHVGAESVKLTANIDIGGYAWARYGFIPTEKDWKDLRVDIRKNLERIQKWPDGVDKQELRGIVKRLTDPTAKREAVRIIAAMRTPVLIQSQGEHHTDKDPAPSIMPLGVALLKRTSWNSTAYLDDPDTQEHITAKLTKP